jgi:DNA invertase Pin-like site-specific DNA recombinase
VYADEGKSGAKMWNRPALQAALAARFEHRRISERQVEKFDELRRQGRARGRASTPRHRRSHPPAAPRGRDMAGHR